MAVIKKQSHLKKQVAIWAFVLGCTGFICGYYGPIILNPGANQGPLFGIFISGPISLFVGIFLGLVAGFAGLKGRANAFALGAASLIVSAVTLTMSLPTPRYVGFIVDAEIRGCKQPGELVADRVAWWNKTQDTKDWSKRLGWEEDVDRIIKKDTGVVLDMWVYRERKLYEQRKFWNRGKVEATAWSAENKSKQFYTRNLGGSCSKYIYGMRKLYFPQWETSTVSPPDNLPTFLGLHVLQDVPVEYQSLIDKP